MKNRAYILKKDHHESIDKCHIELQKNIDIEVDMFLEVVKRKYGYDFRDYSRNHIKRRILNKMENDGFENISMMQNKILYDKIFFSEILSAFSINVTSMFRNIEVFKGFREDIVPYLESYNKLKIWNAGCSTGEEVYSTAVVLKEAGLLQRSMIYATDINEEILICARDNGYSEEAFKEYAQNYLQSGGKGQLEEFFQYKDGYYKIKAEIQKHILFSKHNLACDGVFGEMNMIFCRNVLIYFNDNLQKKVLKLFYDSLAIGGMLCLGMNESIHSSEILKYFKVYDEKHRIYKKIY